MLLDAAAGRVVMRGAWLVIAIGVACGLAVPAAAGAAATPTNFRLTATGTGFPTGGAHTLIVFTPGVETSVPHVGRATVETLLHSGNPFSVRISKKGGTLVLAGPVSGGFSLDRNVGTWSVVEATGRFAGFTGSGTFTWTSRPTAVLGSVNVRVVLHGHVRNS
jgi:hypothetical protein